MKKSRVASNALNNPKAGYSQLARLEPTAFGRRSRRLQLTALEQLSKVLEAKQEIDPHTKKRTLPYSEEHPRGRLSDESLPHLKASEHAAVLNMVSIGAFIFSPMLSIYSSAKAAMMSFTRSMAAEFAPSGIRVNALAPGPVDTYMMQQNPPEVIAGMVGGTLMKRLATPDEMVGAALLLTSDAGSYITGQVVIADGGATPH